MRRYLYMVVPGVGAMAGSGRELAPMMGSGE